jgi:RND family efflux transporter MFP subunit
MTRRRAVLAVAIASGSIFLLACGPKTDPTPAGDLPTATVRVRTVERQERVATEDVVGTVRAKLHAVIEAKISGKIDRMAAVPGQKVRRGELLVRIEAREIQARFEQALAVRRQAEDDLKRYASLLQQNILAPSDYDAAQSKFRVADAGVNEAETLLSYTHVEAPFDGTITRKHADVGDLAAPGKALLELEDSRTLRLEADVPEAVVGSLKLGDRLPVHLPATPDALTGVVSEIAPATDPGSRTFLVKLDLPAAPSLRAGQFGRVAMPVGGTSALRVPASAVVVRGQMELVFVVDEGKVRMRIVKTGRRVGDDIELVSGVEAGESVVVEGASDLVDGQPLRVR